MFPAGLLTPLTFTWHRLSPLALFFFFFLTSGAELRSCVKVEVDVLGSPSLIVRTVSVDVKQH